MAVRPVAAIVLVLALAAMADGQFRPSAHAATGDRPNFSGEWTLNRELSDQPRTANRGADAGDQPPSGGRRGGYGGHGGRGGFGGGYGRRPAPRQSADERATMLEAIGDARSPSPTLTISHSAANIAVTDARGRTRFFQTTGARDKHQYDAGTIESTTSWIGDQLVTQYDLGTGRRLTCTYSFVPETKQLVVRVRIDSGPQFGGRGAATYKYVYDAVRVR